MASPSAETDISEALAETLSLPFCFLSFGFGSNPSEALFNTEVDANATEEV